MEGCNVVKAIACDMVLLRHDWPSDTTGTATKKKPGPSVHDRDFRSRGQACRPGHKAERRTGGHERLRSWLLGPFGECLDGEFATSKRHSDRTLQQNLHPASLGIEAVTAGMRSGRRRNRGQRGLSCWKSVVKSDLGGAKKNAWVLLSMFVCSNSRAKGSGVVLQGLR